MYIFDDTIAFSDANSLASELYEGDLAVGGDIARRGMR
jgi:hypothetical protein